MDLLKNPLRQDLPIPWQSIKRLDVLRIGTVPNADINFSGAMKRGRTEDVKPGGSNLIGAKALDKGATNNQGAKRYEREYIEFDDSDAGADAGVNAEEVEIKVCLVIFSIFPPSDKSDSRC